MNISQKTKNRPIVRPNNSTPGYIPEGNKNTTLKRYLHPNVHSSIVYNSQDMGATSVSINEWMNKKDVINTHTHTHPGILHSHKKEWNLAIYNNMDGLGGYYAKWNKSDRERQILNLKKYNRLVNIATQQKKKQTSRYREQISGYQWGEGREKGQQG